MRKVLLSLFAFLLIATGCEKETKEPSYLSVSPAGDIFLPAQDISKVKVHVTTNLFFTDWDISSDREWCTVFEHRVSGYFYIYCWSNYDPVEQTATITITGKDVPPVYIKVRQGASSLLSITPSDPQTVSARGGRIDVSVKSDEPWTAKSHKQGVVVSPESGDADGVVQVFVDANPNRAPTTATISFSSESASRSLTIEQEGDPNGAYINIDPSGSRKFPTTGGSVVVSIRAKGAWSVSSDKPWVTVETKTGTGNGSTRLSVDANKANDNSTANVSFYAGTARTLLKIEREYTKPAPPPDEDGDPGQVVYSIDGNYIRQGLYGSVVYYIDGKSILKGYLGSVVYTIDGNYIREGYYGRAVYYIDGKYIRNGYLGSIVYTIDGKYIRRGFAI